MKLKIAICDDERIVSEDIQDKIKSIRTDCQIDIYNVSSKILENASEYDMIFLDIEMPEVDGMKISIMLREQGYRGFIVFLTSHMEFMQDAFKVKAFRFLGKPVDVNELKETVVEAEKETYSNKHIVVTDYGAEYAINVSSIHYIKANGNKTIIVLKNETIETNKTLKQWLNELGTSQFCQVHKSYVVSFKNVKKIDIDVIILHDMDEEIPISRRSIARVKKAFCSYIRENAMPI